MAGNLYMTVVNGVKTLINAIQTSSGAGDAGKLVALNSAGKIDNTMLDQSPAQTFTASEAITGPALVNIHNSSGAKVRYASNTGIATAADGYAPNSISNGATGTVILGEGVISGFVGLTVGAEYFLGANGAVITAGSLPSSSGSIVQRIGRAVSTTELAFDRSEPIVNP